MVLKYKTKRVTYFKLLPCWSCLNWAQAYNSTRRGRWRNTSSPSHPFLFLVPVLRALPTRYPHGETQHNYEEFSLYDSHKRRKCKLVSILSHTLPLPEHSQQETIKANTQESWAYSQRQMLSLSVKGMYPWEISDQLRLVPPRAALMEKGEAGAASTLCPVLLNPHPPNTRQCSRPCRKVIHHKYLTKPSL